MVINRRARSSRAAIPSISRVTPAISLVEAQHEEAAGHQRGGANF
jgi:hypothetical protein